MIKVKDVGASATKFVQRAQSAAPDYAAGVAGAGALWQANSAAAETNWSLAVSEAAANDRYRKGVNKAGPGKYTSRASGVGAQRYPQGVSQAGPTWQAGVGPYITAISNMTLPPRRPTGDPGNMARVQAITAGLRALKLSL